MLRYANEGLAMSRTFEVIAKVSKDLAAIRDAQDAESNAIAQLLHVQDEQSRCLRVILKFVKHLHSANAKRKVRRRDAR